MCSVTGKLRQHILYLCAKFSRPYTVLGQCVVGGGPPLGGAENLQRDRGQALIAQEPVMCSGVVRLDEGLMPLF